MATPTGHPGRTLIVLAVIVAGLIGLMAVSNTWTPEARSRPAGRHHHHPDRGEHHRHRAGRPHQPAAGQDDHPEPGRQPRRRRVGGHHRRRQADHRQRAQRPAGRAGPAGRPDRGAAVPGRVRRRAGHPAAHRDRRSDRRADHRAHAGPVGRAPSARPSQPSAGPPEPSASTTGNNRPMPALPTAPPQPIGEACANRRRRRARRPTRPSTGSPARPDQAAFAAFTCAIRQVDRRRRPAAVRLQPGRDREVPARSDPDRGQPADQRHRGHPAERRQLGRQPGVQLRGRDRVRERHPGARRPRATRRTGSPSCSTASRSPHRR